MTQEDKELLVKDLSARLTYGVKIELMPITRGKCTTLTPIILYDYYISNDVNYLPYLFPLSSMTEEEKEEYCQLQQKIIYNSKGVVNEDITEYIKWCYKKHLDINDLIPKGLAIDATNLNIY